MKNTTRNPTKKRKKNRGFPDPTSAESRVALHAAEQPVFFGSRSQNSWSHADEATYVRWIAESGRSVVVFDDLSTGHEEAVAGLPFENVDLLDRPALESAFDDYPDIRAVMFFAGRISVPESVAFPEIYYRINLVGALTLFDVMVQRGVERIVFSSSAAVYGEPDLPRPLWSPLGWPKPRNWRLQIWRNRWKCVMKS